MGTKERDREDDVDVRRELIFEVVADIGDGDDDADGSRLEWVRKAG